MPAIDFSRDILMTPRLAAGCETGAVSARLIEEIEALANRAAFAMSQAGRTYVAAAGDNLSNRPSESSHRHARLTEIVNDLAVEAGQGILAAGSERRGAAFREQQAAYDGPAEIQPRDDARLASPRLSRNLEAALQAADGRAAESNARRPASDARFMLTPAAAEIAGDSRGPFDGPSAALAEDGTERAAREIPWQTLDRLQELRGESARHEHDSALLRSSPFRVPPVQDPGTTLQELAPPKVADWSRMPPEPYNRPLQVDPGGPERLDKDRADQRDGAGEDARGEDPSLPHSPAELQAAIEKSGADVAAAIETTLVNAILARDERLHESVRRAVARLNSGQIA